MLWLDTQSARSNAPRFVDEGARWTLVLDIPGAKKEDVSVTVDGGALTLTARREVAGAGRLLHQERRAWSLKHTWDLPEGVDGSAITAALEHGVLQVAIPKPPVSEPRRIDIQVN
jgi:HSP20 family protein